MLLRAFRHPLNTPEYQQQQVKPASGIRGFCPSCGAPVHGKQSTKTNTSWFAHDPGRACTDNWKTDSKGESSWHVKWKEDVASVGATLEQSISFNGVRHRTDALSKSGCAIEFQSSKLREDEFRERSQFYRENSPSQDLIWVIKTRTSKPSKRGETWFWESPLPISGTSETTVILDLDDSLLILRSIEFLSDGGASIKGSPINRRSILEHINNSNEKSMSKLKVTDNRSKNSLQESILAEIEPTCAISSNPAIYVEENPEEISILTTAIDKSEEKLNPPMSNPSTTIPNIIDTQHHNLKSLPLIYKFSQNNSKSIRLFKFVPIVLIFLIIISVFKIYSLTH